MGPVVEFDHGQGGGCVPIDQGEIDVLARAPGGIGHVPGLVEDGPEATEEGPGDEDDDSSGEEGFVSATLAVGERRARGQ